jgi:alanyl-tRNA synthetase
MTEMKSGQIRQRFLEFFVKKKHVIVPSSSLVPEDPTVLLTTAGMQQFKGYYLEKESPYGNKVVSIQKCFRTSDIDKVGDESHLTFFEMLGNFSFKGAYFKKEAIDYAYRFIRKELGLKIDYVSVFSGDKEIEADIETEKIWQKLKTGNNENFAIKKFGKKDNFWGPTGDEGPCGPTTEIYINDTEIWNLVFNEYYCDQKKSYKRLEQPGVDTGMGLERLTMVVSKKKNVFETDLFAPITNQLNSGINSVISSRIVADHLKAAVFLIADGIQPSNTERGYILRRLIRRASLHLKNPISSGIVAKIVNIYRPFYPELSRQEKTILETLKQEEAGFKQTLKKGLKVFEKIADKDISGRDAFMLFSTYGFPLELTKELAQKKGISVEENKFWEEFRKHQEKSRSAAKGMFKSGLAGHSEKEIKYHTATHLLLAALRKVLGKQVVQKGSNITSERLRLDFSFPRKITEEEKKAIEDLVNQKIKENLRVSCEEMNLAEAIENGALGSFEEKYGNRVKVYSIGDFSKEICAGPHVQSTSSLGRFIIKKEEASSAGTRRIKAILKDN